MAIRSVLLHNLEIGDLVVGGSICNRGRISYLERSTPYYVKSIQWQLRKGYAGYRVVGSDDKKRVLSPNSKVLVETDQSIGTLSILAGKMVDINSDRASA